MSLPASASLGECSPSCMIAPIQSTSDEPDVAHGSPEAIPPFPGPKEEIDGSQSSTSEDKVEEVIVHYNPDEYGIRRIIRNFSPSWFSVNMATGGVSGLLYQIPYTARWLHILSTITFVLNIVLWLTFLVLSCFRYILYPELWTALLQNPTERLFLGAIPTGLGTIINSMIFICVPSWGQGIAIFAWALWWINGAVSVFLCFYLTLVSINVHKVDLSGMTPLWLLPVLPMMISSASGGLLASVLTDQVHQYWTLIISYVLWGIGGPLAIMILVLYFYRLMVHEMLEKEVVVSAFLPIGPFGLAGFAIFLFGKDAITIFPENGVLPLAPSAGQILYVFGFAVSLIMWGFGLLWIFFAVSAIYSCKRFPFNMGWWGFVFPLAVFALSTIQLGKELDSAFFKVLGTILSVIVFMLYIMVSIGTILDSFSGKAFFAPCLSVDMKNKELKIKRIIKKAASKKP